MDVEEIRTRIVSLEKRIASLGGNDASGQMMRESFPMGLSGRSRGTSRAAAKRMYRGAQNLERTIDNAVALEPLLREKERLNVLLQEIESGKREQRKLTRLALRDAQLERIRNAKPGQYAITAFGNPVEIKKVNQKSITTISGSRYTFDEIIDIDLR